MTDLTFEAKLNWSGTGKNGEGKVTFATESLVYSSPANMGGKGTGVSPEDLLISAVSSCYSGTLFGLLIKKELPVLHVSVRAEGIVTGYPLNTKFSRLIVHPTIIGGDPEKLSEYEETATKARDKCFIGKSIAGNIDYQVGTVQVTKVILEQSKVDELVDEFYNRLTKEPVFTALFAERNVDTETLKDRQKRFLSRLVNEDTQESHQDQSNQVKQRHAFITSPERSKLWLDTMEKTIDDMTFSAEVKELLKNKINLLMGNVVKN
jgi:peroxiredoxin-like protein